MRRGGIFNRWSRRVRLWLRQWLAGAMARLYEGPQPSDRLQGFVFEYVRFYPHATRMEWMAFALRLGDEMFKSGYLRGHELGLAEGLHRKPQEVEWSWGVPLPDFSRPFLSEKVNDEREKTEEGIPDEERAQRHLWRQLVDGERMVSDAAAKEPRE